MTPLERIRRYLESTGRAAPCRVLLVFGNPLGNAIGDTVIALDHARYLPRLTGNVRVSVWTSNPELWAQLHPEVRAIPFLSRQALTRDYDVVVWASTPVPEGARDVMREAGVASLSWFGGSPAVAVALGGRERFEAPLPPFVNYTLRIPEVYRALGWRTAPPARVATTNDSNVVLVNPYASRAWKSLPPRFLARLLAALRHALAHAGLSMVVPAQPKGLTRGDDLAYAVLGEIVASSATPSVVLPLDRSSYFAQIRQAALVIGPDTSTQHLAAAFGVPSIACYSSEGETSYLDWGPVAPTCLHFTLPDDRDAGAQRSLARLIADITPRLGGLPARSVDPVPATHAALLEHAQAFTRACDRYLRGQSSSRRTAREALARLEGAIRPEWVPHLAGELKVVYQDLPALRNGCSAADRRIARARLSHLNVLRVLRLLNARPAALRSSADRGARSRGLGRPAPDDRSRG